VSYLKGVEMKRKINLIEWLLVAIAILLITILGTIIF